MPKQEDRGSLIGLKANLPAVPKVQPVRAAPEAGRLLLGEGDTSLQTGVKTYVRTSLPDDSPAAAAQARARRKEPTVLLNAKLPLSLHTRLKRTAQFNDLSMTDILIRALEYELGSDRYARPPEVWGGEPGS